MSDRSIAAAEIASVLRNEAAKFRQLASAEEKPKTRESFLGLAHSYELTAKSILKNGVKSRLPNRF